MASVRKGAMGEGGPAREYKYTQEISQMVNSYVCIASYSSYTSVWQMFVFGEVQDPNMDTVNLVEDIVRSQLIELVRMQPECDDTDFAERPSWHRLFKLVLSPLVVGRDTSPLKTLYFSFVTIEGKSIDCGRIYPGKMCGNTRRIRGVMEAEEWK
jgi:Transcription initiation factor IID, 18kD subunit